MIRSTGFSEIDLGGAEARTAMVREQIAQRGVRDPRVLSAMNLVPRELFVPVDLRRHSYEDRPLPIGENQTISQPFIVAYMTELLGLRPAAKVLEVGTGSGYQTAVLALLAERVYTIENCLTLSERARCVLEELGLANVEFRHGDGYLGWPEAAPFDAILVTAAPSYVPGALVEQLAPGGTLVLPVGRVTQQLLRIHKSLDGTLSQEHLTDVRFVPLTSGIR